MAQISITNVINISVAATNLGVNSYNTSNLGLFTDELPADTFGTSGFKLYVDSVSVATDFGSASKTAQMATAVFSQQPNILQGNGQLVVILLGVATQTLALSGVATSGAFTVGFGGNTSASIAFGSTASQIQAILQVVPGLAGVSVSGSIASQSLAINMGGIYGASPSTFTFPTNTLETSGSTAVTITPTISAMGETIGAAITRTSSLVQYFGIIVDETVTQIGSDDVTAAAAIVQSLNKIAGWVSYEEADIQADGILTAFTTASQSQNRGLYYGDDSVVSGYTGFNAILMMAAYFGGALSVNFSGSNTTTTENLKTLINIQPDPSMTQTIFNEAATAGADIYPSIDGDSSIINNGANQFFDDVYNLRWFVGALQVAGYNYLAQTATKIPQTEPGMDGLKGAYRAICQQGVTNQMIAPGSWTNPTTFGNQALLLANVAQFGYYIYSQPIAQQAQTDRAARKAPLVQLCFKYAGAIQTSDVIVYVNS